MSDYQSQWQEREKKEWLKFLWVILTIPASGLVCLLISLIKPLGWATDAPYTAIAFGICAALVSLTFFLLFIQIAEVTSTESNKWVRLLVTVCAVIASLVLMSANFSVLVFSWVIIIPAVTIVGLLFLTLAPWYQPSDTSSP